MLVKIAKKKVHAKKLEIQIEERERLVSLSTTEDVAQVNECWVAEQCRKRDENV